MGWNPSGWQPDGWQPTGTDPEGAGDAKASEVVPLNRIIVAHPRKYIIRPVIPVQEQRQ